MQLLPAIAIAYLGVAWAFPSPMERQLYFPCTSSDIFNSAWCCKRGFLGDVSSCQIAILPFSDKNFQDQCGFFDKTAVCCIRPLLIGISPTLCIPVSAGLASSEETSENVSEGKLEVTSEVTSGTTPEGK